MMNRKVTGLMLYGAMLFTGRISQAAPQSTTQEPPAQYVLTVNGKAVTINLNEENQVDLKATGPSRVKLSQIPTRTFDKAGVKFSYPVRFSFEADDSDRDVIMWTMIGASSMVMLQKYQKVVDTQLLNAVVPEIIKQYPAKSTAVTPTSIMLGKKNVAGRKLNVTIEGTKLVQEIFALSNAKSSFTLILQDTLTEEGKPTSEGINLRKLISSSLVIQ